MSLASQVTLFAQAVAARLKANGISPTLFSGTSDAGSQCVYKNRRVTWNFDYNNSSAGTFATNIAQIPGDGTGATDYTPAVAIIFGCAYKSASDGRWYTGTAILNANGNLQSLSNTTTNVAAIAGHVSWDI